MIDTNSVKQEEFDFNIIYFNAVTLMIFLLLLFKIKKHFYLLYIINNKLRIPCVQDLGT